MSVAVCHCPTCGAPYTGEVPRVDLDRNIFICSAGWVQLTRQRAELVSALLEAYPRGMRVDRLVYRLYGASETSEDPVANLRVQVSNARRYLRWLGWTIRNDYGSYYLEKFGGRE